MINGCNRNKIAELFNDRNKSETYFSLNLIVTFISVFVTRIGSRVCSTRVRFVPSP